MEGPQVAAVILDMRRMVKELDRHPEMGCLGYHVLGLTTIQYWRSFDHLEAYAQSRDHEHWPVWVRFNRRMAACRGDVGIWHETYLIPAGSYEAIYSGMPLHGLGRFGQLVSLGGDWSHGARQRLGPVNAQQIDLYGTVTTA